MLHVLKNRSFMLLAGGQSLSLLGDQIYSVALMWYVMERTGSTMSLGMTTISMMLPAILVAPWAGVFADKNIKKELLIITDLLQAIIMFILAALTIHNGLPLTALNICLVAASAVQAFFSPALSSTIPLVVDKKFLSQANAFGQFVRQISNIIGPAAGGILMTFLPISLLFVLNGCSFLISASFSICLRIPNVCVSEIKQSFFSRFAEGVRYTFQIRRLLILILVGGIIINFFLAPVEIFLVVISHQMHFGAQGLGWIESSISAGALLGSAVILSGLPRNQIRFATVGLIMEGASLLLAGRSTHFTAFIGAFGLLGLGVCFASVGIGTAFQLIIDDDKRGRVNSFNQMLVSCTIPAGLFTGSLLAGRLPISYILIGYGIIVTLSALFLVPPFRNELQKSRCFR